MERQMCVGFELCEHKLHRNALRFMKCMGKQDGLTNEIEHRIDANVP
jgi:hypothetical protein